MSMTTNGPDGPVHPGVRPSDYLPTLDGWRAIAILWVIAVHDQFHIREHFYGMAGELPFFWLVRAGAYGVDIFFALSGFLITSRLIAEDRRRGRIDLASFYARRSFRILPAWFVCLGATAAAKWFGFSVSLKTLAWTMATLRNYVPPARSADSMTIHFWSLAVEEHFYLLWPAALILIGVSRRSALVAALVALGCVLWRSIDPRFHIVTGLLHIPTNEGIGRTDYRLDGLLWGCVLAIVVANPESKARLRRWLGPSVQGLLLILLLALIWVTPLGQRGALSAPVITLMIVATTLNPSRFTGRFLELPALRWIGRLSYSLYLWQQIFIMPEWNAPNWFVRRYPVDLVAAVVVALASYYGIERPFVKLGHRVAGRLNRRPPSPVAAHESLVPAEASAVESS